jgi:hypothetical protein
MKHLVFLKGDLQLHSDHVVTELVNLLTLGLNIQKYQAADQLEFSEFA